MHESQTGLSICIQNEMLLLESAVCTECRYIIIHADAARHKLTSTCLQEKAETDWLARTKHVDLERLRDEYSLKFLLVLALKPSVVFLTTRKTDRNYCLSKRGSAGSVSCTD